MGKKKVKIPDGVNTFWPDGDALVGNFVYKDGKLTGFVDTKALTINDSKSTIINYDYVNINLPSIKDGDINITLGERCKNLIISYGSETDSGNTGDTIVLGTKYLGCTTVKEVKTINSTFKTSDVIDGVWSESLANLIDGDSMFNNCSDLTTFISDLSSLSIGSSMFYACPNLSSFKADLPELTKASYMFYGCTSLTSFTSKLSYLNNGNSMFNSCTNLTSFSANLNNLTSGSYMFHNCKLDTKSIQNIASTINETSGGMLYVGIGNSTPNTEEEVAFNTIASKGWRVFVNGSEFTPTSSSSITTLDENGEEITTPIPYYAKPVPSDEENARYVDENGDLFDIVGGQFIYGDDLSTYGMFICEEDAAANMRLTKIEKPLISKFVLKH